MIYLTLFLEFLKIGLFCFGGAFGMIPLIRETVLAHEWLTEDAFYDLVGVCESTPGPIAVNMATYIGSTQAGILGSIVATLGVILPAFVIILLVASVLKKLTTNVYFKGFMQGVNPVIIGLILSTGAVLLLKVLGYTDLQTFDFDYIPLVILGILGTLYAVLRIFFKKKLGAIPLILISILLGISFGIIQEVLV